MSKKKIGLIGGRGFVGGEFITLLRDHTELELAFASSSSKAGQPITGVEQNFIALSPAQISDHRGLDALVLAVPNGQASAWVTAVDQAKLDCCILDISADHRFDPTWVYGLPEMNGPALAGAKRIANPGCYATAAALALVPLRDILSGPPSVFGVSGYSGAGATPNPRNDPANLADNLLAYSLSGHIHEREISHHLGQKVHFTPHVAEFFRGILLSIHLKFAQPVSAPLITEALQQYYQYAPLVHVVDEIPNIQQVTGTPDARIGGVIVDDSGLHGVVVVCLDNLLKGAASQAIQNLEIALTP